MKITNMNALPAFMVEAVTRDDHSMEGVKYSATQLCKPPRILQLERRHKEEITNEASDFWNMFIGTAVHGGIFEALKKNEDYLMEQRFIIELGGVKISGSPDCYQKSTCTLFDHKTMQTSAFGLEAKPEYEQQLNIYAYILRKNGYDVKKLMINAIYLDWRKAAMKFADPTKYPMTPCRLVHVNLWDDATVEAFLLERIALHEASEKLLDEELPNCSKEETWESAAKLAIYRNGGLRAMKLCDNHAEALSYLKYKNVPVSAVTFDQRPATRRRCEQYCSAAPFCNQYQNWLLNNKPSEI